MIRNKNFYVFAFVLAATLWLTSACERSESDTDKKYRSATQSFQQGHVTHALKLLKEINMVEPNRPEIIELIAKAHQRMGSYLDAAFQFEMLASTNENLDHFFINAAKNYEEGGDLQSSKLAYIRYLKKNPEDGANWIEMARILISSDDNKAALDAYLKGIELLPSDPNCDQSTELGKLFLSFGNDAQAERRFKAALKDQDGFHLPALISLLSIYKERKDWSSSEKAITIIKRDYPGAIETTAYAELDKEILVWKEESERLKALKEKEELLKKAKALAAAVEAAEPVVVATVADSKYGGVPVIAETTDETIIEESEATSIDESHIVQEEEPSSSSELIASTEPEVDTLEEPVTTASLSPEVQQPVVKEDPMTVVNEEIVPPVATNTIPTIEPTAPKKEKRAYRLQPLPPIKPFNQEEKVTAEYSHTPVPLPPIKKAIIPEKAADDDAIKRGKEQLIAKNYKDAISHFWDATSINPTRAETWYLLSRAFLLTQELDFADSTIKEAIRNDPKNEHYVIESLKIIKKLYTPKQFMDELESAKEIFPNNPKILLSLANGYNQIYKKPGITKIIYQEFLQKHPKHPMSGQVKRALQRIRVPSNPPIQ